MAGESSDQNQTGAGRTRDPLADYVMSPEDRAAAPKNSPLITTNATARERLAAEVEEARQRLAQTSYPAVDPHQSAPPSMPQPDVWPPPVYGQGPALGQMDALYGISPYRSASGIAKVTVALLIVNMFTAAILVAAAAMGSDVMALVLLSGLRTLVEIGYLVAFFAWTYRAYANLRSFHAGGLMSTPMMAVAAWFIPIISFYRPWQIINELWRASDPSIRINPLRPNDWQMSDSNPLITFWWLSWFLPILVIAGAVSSSFAQMTGYYCGIGLTSMLTSFMTILVVNGITARQDQKAATLYQ